IFNNFFLIAKESAHLGYLVSGVYDSMTFLASAEHLDFAGDAHAVVFTIYAILSLIEQLRGKRRGSAKN
ncbi:hypothetical protein ACCT25_30260, partial [Rhizobium ruizarguesonis]